MGVQSQRSLQGKGTFTCLPQGCIAAALENRIGLSTYFILPSAVFTLEALQWRSYQFIEGGYLPQAAHCWSRAGWRHVALPAVAATSSVWPSPTPVSLQNGVFADAEVVLGRHRGWGANAGVQAIMSLAAGQRLRWVCHCCSGLHRSPKIRSWFTSGLQPTVLNMLPYSIS